MGHSARGMIGSIAVLAVAVEDAEVVGTFGSCKISCDAGDGKCDGLKRRRSVGPRSSFQNWE